MSQLRVAEFDLYQELPEEGLREVLRQVSENVRNLQAQKDDLESRVLNVELDVTDSFETQEVSSSSSSSSSSGSSSSSSTVTTAIIYSIALG